MLICLISILSWSPSLRPTSKSEVNSGSLGGSAPSSRPRSVEINLWFRVYIGFRVAFVEYVSRFRPELCGLIWALSGFRSQC